MQFRTISPDSVIESHARAEVKFIEMKNNRKKIKVFVNRIKALIFLEAVSAI